ncbi:MAG: hypothetical protein FJ206_12615 [Gemmatimonadetes bacterium]|nr:hypothetical protein [Gemmatimonadota bacterium]
MTSPVLLSRFSQDLGFDTRGLARYVGNLEEGRSKVSVNSSLSPGDRWDHFRFGVTAEQFVRVRTGELVGEDGAGNEVAKAGTVRYQLLSASGQIIADSDPDSGGAHEAWQDLISDTNLRLVKGSYTLRVARDTEAVNNKDYVYSFTFRSGLAEITNDTEETAFREFLTTERPAIQGATFDQFAHVTAVLGLFADVRVF